MIELPLSLNLLRPKTDIIYSNSPCLVRRDLI